MTTLLDLAGVACLVAAAYLSLGLVAALVVVGIFLLAISFRISTSSSRRRG